MSKRRHFSVEEKYSIILDVIEGSQSVNGAAKKYSVSFTTIMKWLRKYETSSDFMRTYKNPPVKAECPLP
jgi:transposase-like protein